MLRTASHHVAVCQRRLWSQNCFSFPIIPSLQLAHVTSVRAGPLPFGSLEVSCWGAGYLIRFLSTRFFLIHHSLDEKHFDLTQLP